MRNKIILLLMFVFLGAGITVEKSDKIQDLVGFSNMRGFSTLETSSLPLNGGTLTGALFGTSASLSSNFEVGGYASLSQAFIRNAFIQGSKVASGSNAYQAEFVSTGTVSLNFQGTSADKGTCLQLQNTTGTPVYARVVGTTLTINTLECRN